MEGVNLKMPLKISELLRGVTFELNNDDDDLAEEFELNWTNSGNELDRYRNPCSSTFDELRSEMVEISKGVFKKIIRKADDDAKNIDLVRQRITYHRNFYLEAEDHPFDSTYLNARTDVIWLAAERRTSLKGIVEAIESMKEGEQSLFVISYKKMFGENGCPPRITPQADILCDLKILKVENVGDPEKTAKIIRGISNNTPFADVEDCIEEARVTASDFYSRKNFDKAIKLYQQILQTAHFASTKSTDEEERCRGIKTRALLNLAICFNQKQEPSKAIEYIADFEKLESIEKQPKVLFAKGRALMMMSEFNEAQKCLKMALKLAPLNKQIADALVELREKKMSYDAFLKNFSKNLKTN